PLGRFISLLLRCRNDQPQPVQAQQFADEQFLPLAALEGQKVAGPLLAGKDGAHQEAWAGARAFADHCIERLLLAVGQWRSLSVEQVAFHLAGLGIKLQKGAVAATVDAERELDFGLGMRGEVVKRQLLPRELPEQGGKDRADQSGLAGAVFSDQGDKAWPHAVEVNANFARKGLRQASESEVA